MPGSVSIPTGFEEKEKTQRLQFRKKIGERFHLKDRFTSNYQANKPEDRHILPLMHMWSQENFPINSATDEGKKMKHKPHEKIWKSLHIYAANLRAVKHWGVIFSRNMQTAILTVFPLSRKYTPMCVEHLCPNTWEQPEQVHISFFLAYLFLFFFNYNLSFVTRRISRKWLVHDSDVLQRIVPWPIHVSSLNRDFW